MRIERSPYSNLTLEIIWWSEVILNRVKSFMLTYG